MTLIRLLVLAFALLAANEVRACERMNVIPPAVRVAVADLIVEARVDRFGDGRVTVTPSKIHKGSIADRQIEVAGVTTPSRDTSDCDGLALVQGKTYLFLMFDRLPGESSWQAINNIDGVVELSAATELLQTKGVSTAWTRRTDGLWLKAAAKKAAFSEKEEIDIYAIFRNGTATPRALQVRSWPPTERTSCVLEGDGIAGVRVPIPQNQIDDYFTRNPMKFDFLLGPGATTNWELSRVTTAKQGWGYKERLDFQYFPMKPGRHEVSVVCHGFGDEALRAAGLRFVIADPAPGNGQ